MLKTSDALGAFLREQQEPNSSNYHRWLTPEQFADKFGLSPGDIGKLTSWLRSQGLQVDDVARGRHWITFSGSAEQVSRAFRTEIHKYQVDGKTHFSNVSVPSIPAAFENVVSAVRGLNDFGLRSMSMRAKPEANLGSEHDLAPDDIATIYDIAPLYAAGITGAGQKLVVVGQTDIDITDIQKFRARFNLPPNDPQLVLYGDDPGTSYGDLPEADLDIEWSGAVARDATIIYVYSQDVDTSAQYAVDQNLAPVMTMSYGDCELWGEPGFESIAQQANAQGITWMVASGDWGAATCDVTSATQQAAKGPTVSFPASIPEVTAIGGTEFDETGGTYWNLTNIANGASALSWIPEKVWNDTAERSELAASGGGASGLFAKPVWQTGPGVPNDNARDLPDVSFSSSPDHDGYEVFTEGDLSFFGGTSVASPVFAGIVALLNQHQGVQGLGNINPMLYRLAQSTTDVFHDVIAGDNMVPCVQSSAGCFNGMLGFNAGTGYDLATGLGSVDAWHLANEWQSGTATTTTVTASPFTFLTTDSVQLTATVTSANSVTAPTGTINFLANDNSLGTVALVASGQTATASLSVTGVLLAGGTGTVTALYSGDAVFNASSGTTPTSLTLPAAGALIVPSLTPNPVPQENTPEGPYWPYTVALKEKAGVGATLLTFTVDGVHQNLSYWTSKSIPANGTISASLEGHGLVPPVNRVFHFTGIDALGNAWSQELTVPFLNTSSPVLAPTVAMVSSPTTVQQDPTQPPACQWSHQLTLQEMGGFEVEIIDISTDSVDFGDNLQQMFGTTQMAPFGMLQANICREGLPGTDTYTFLGISEVGTFVESTLSVVYAAAPTATPPAFTITPAAVNLSMPDSSQPASATVNINFDSGTPNWTAQILPSNRTSAWLTLSPASGSGSAQLQLTAAAGLSNGVYNAVIGIQPDSGSPQAISVPVTFVVGASPDVFVDHASNAASYAKVYVPGMALAVFGTNLAPNTQIDLALPLPLTMQGVSVTVNGVTAPLYYVSPTQLNVQIPYETTLGTAVMGINNNGKVTSFTFPVSAVGPGIFSDLNGVLVPYLPGQQGQAVTAFMTGDGVLVPTLPTGAAPYPDTPVDFLPAPNLPVTMTVGGVPATVDFVGMPTWAVGTTQINFTIPLNAPLGPQPVVVSVGGVDSAPVTLTVTAAPAAQ